jgi:hypothetical protein
MEGGKPVAGMYLNWLAGGVVAAVEVGAVEVLIAVAVVVVGFVGGAEGVAVVVDAVVAGRLVGAVVVGARAEVVAGL